VSNDAENSNLIPGINDIFSIYSHLKEILNDNNIAALKLHSKTFKKNRNNSKLLTTYYF